MDIKTFGTQLIRTEDLDPVYSMLAGATGRYTREPADTAAAPPPKYITQDELCRFLIAYWCFYHCGASAYIAAASGRTFWRMMEIAAANELPAPTGGRWPRAHERRHFRGQKAVDAVRWLADMWPRPEDLVLHLMEGSAALDDVLSKVKRLPQFGPWIGFKIADMLERVLGSRIVFPPDLGIMYREPAAALDILSSEDGRRSDAHWNDLLGYFRQFKAPPTFDRPCGPQEVETILCKWKSMRGGHYYVGKDIREIDVGLQVWGNTAPLVNVLRLHLPPIPTLAAA